MRRAALKLLKAAPEPLPKKKTSMSIRRIICSARYDYLETVLRLPKEATQARFCDSPALTANEKNPCSRLSLGLEPASQTGEWHQCYARGRHERGAQRYGNAACIRQIQNVSFVHEEY